MYPEPKSKKKFILNFLFKIINKYCALITKSNNLLAVFFLEFTFFDDHTYYFFFLFVCSILLYLTFVV